jgi:hypothetical protein
LSLFRHSSSPLEFMIMIDASHPCSIRIIRRSIDHWTMAWHTHGKSI